MQNNSSKSNHSNICNSHWVKYLCITGFHLGYFVPSVALFGFSFFCCPFGFFQLRCPFCFMLLFVAFLLLTLLVAALFGFSLILMSIIFHRSRIETNEWKLEWKMLFVAFCCSFWFCCSSLLVLWDRISSVSRTKTGKCLSLLVLVFLLMFPFEHCIARFGFFVGTKNQNEQLKPKKIPKSKWKPGLTRTPFISPWYSELHSERLPLPNSFRPSWFCSVWW